MRTETLVSCLYVCGLLLLPTTLIAADTTVRSRDGIEIIVPAKSPVQFSALGEYAEIRFKGQFVLTGTFHYGYESDNPEDDTAYTTPALSFAPDAAVAATLPYWKDRERVSKILFSNEDAFVRAVILARTRTALKARRIKSVSGRIAIVVDNYQANLECDAPSYTVRFLSVHKPGAAQIARNTVEPTEC